MSRVLAGDSAVVRCLVEQRVKLVDVARDEHRSVAQLKGLRVDVIAAAVIGLDPELLESQRVEIGASPPPP